MRSLPWVRAVSNTCGPRGVTVIGIHTPEFPHERSRAAVEQFARENALEYPILLDNDAAYWDALRNEYWPAVYLVDRHGRIRSRHVGEVHAGDGAARALEAEIERLLAEDELDAIARRWRERAGLPPG